MLVGTGNGTFAWSGPNGFTSTEQNPTVNAAGTYNLTVTGTNGCTSTASAVIEQDDEVPGASAQGGTLNCMISEHHVGGHRQRQLRMERPERLHQHRTEPNGRHGRYLQPDRDRRERLHQHSLCCGGAGR